MAARGWGGGGSGGGRVAAARARTRVRPERAGAPGPAGARPGARAAVGEGRRLHAPALRQSPTVAAAAPRWLRNAAAPHNHGVRGHGSGLRFPALLGNRDRTSGEPGRQDAAFPSTLGSVCVSRGCVCVYVCVRVCEREE